MGVKHNTYAIPSYVVNDIMTLVSRLGGEGGSCKYNLMCGTILSLVVDGNITLVGL